MSREATEFLPSDYELAYPPGIERHFWTMARNSILLDELTRQGCLGLKWLEVGCGRGLVLRFLRAAGVDVTGVELAPVEPIAEMSQFIYSGLDARDLPLEVRSRTEGLMLLDVIEHIENPGEFLRKLLDALPAVKIILIAVPARKELWSNYDEHYGHFRRYDEAQLRAHLQEGGANPVALRYLFRPLYPVAWLIARLGKQRSIQVFAPNGILAIIHQYIAMLLRWDAKRLPAMLPGTSLLCFAERNPCLPAYSNQSEE